jgi:hypothetical protein
VQANPVYLWSLHIVPIEGAVLFELVIGEIPVQNITKAKHIPEYEILLKHSSK